MIEQEMIVVWKNNNRSLMDSGDWRMNACLHFQSDMSYGYINGYRRAGRILYEYLIRSDMNLDSLVYPIIFSYRHHFEIQLKKILGIGLALLEMNEGVGTHHNIITLWSRIRGVLKKIYGNDRTDYIESIEKYLTELHTLDPSGTEFRYHRKMDSSLSLVGIRNINLSNVVEILEELADCIDGIASDFDHKFDTLCEMRSYSGM